MSSPFTFTRCLASRPLKITVHSNLDSPHVGRCFNTIWTYRLGQLTSSNVRRMKSASTTFLSSWGGSGSNNSSTSSSSNNQSAAAWRDASSTSSSSHGTGATAAAAQESPESPMKSDLQPHALHKFHGESDWSLVIVVPKSSDHYRNVLECKRVSFMVGHTDAQLFHWFKQLGTMPPRALLSGTAEILQGAAKDEVWSQTLIRHPILHAMAQDMWESNASKTTAEEVHIAQREREEDDKRMRRMSSSDWRAKFRDRERNPTAAADEEAPIYVMKPDTFAVLRMQVDTRLWMGPSNRVQRVWDCVIPAPDPLCRCAGRFIRMLNLSRPKLVPSLNINYSLKLVNAFVFEIDHSGLWVMGTQENVAGKNGCVREEWSEMKLDFGKDQLIKTEQEMEWWVRGLTKLGAPEMTQSDNTIDDANMNSEDYDFRHI